MSSSTTIADATLLARRDHTPPDLVGRSKRLWLLPHGQCLVELIPSLRSYTYDRDELVTDTDTLRLDFYERAARALAGAGVATAFIRRVASTLYLAEYHPAPPFETIVKNWAVGSTLIRYPGLFSADAPLPRPVVKFDYRVDPEDQPIGEDYLRALAVPVDEFRRLALRVNDVLCRWLAPLELWDVCLIFGLDPDGSPVLISEVSPDCMRLRRRDGSSLDKDLFRRGAAGHEVVAAWETLLREID